MEKSSKTKSINSSNRLLDRIVHTSNHHCCLWSNCLLKSLCWYNILVEEGPFYTYIKEPYRLVQLSKRNWKSSTFFLLSPFSSSEANKEQRFIVKKRPKKKKKLSRRLIKITWHLHQKTNTEKMCEKNSIND